MKIYTDGSRIKAANVEKEEYLKGWGTIIGWATVTPGKDPLNADLFTTHNGGSHIGGSNVNAEMFAITDAIFQIYEEVTGEPAITDVEISNVFRSEKVLYGIKPNEEVEIITDSKVSVQIIEKAKIQGHSKGVKYTINNLLAFAAVEAIKILEKEGNKVTFKLVRGHGKDSSMTSEDIIGNGQADLSSTNNSTDLLLSSSSAEQRKAIDEFVKNSFVEKWYK